MFLKSIYYTNEAVDLPIYASLKVGNGICSEQSEISLGYKSFILDKKQNGCVTSFDGTVYDYHYRFLDKGTSLSFLLINNIYEHIGYSCYSIKPSLSIYLYYRPFIGYDLNCTATYPNAINKIDNNNTIIKICGIIEIVLLSLLCIECILFIGKTLYILTTKKLNIVKINLGFAICSSVLGLITLSIFITLRCLSFNNLCLDDFYTELYQYYGKKNTDVKYFALIQSIMLFVPCITFIIFCKTNKKENEINKIDDNALANDENEAAAPIIS